MKKPRPLVWSPVLSPARAWAQTVRVGPVGQQSSKWVRTKPISAAKDKLRTSLVSTMCDLLKTKTEGVACNCEMLLSTFTWSELTCTDSHFRAEKKWIIFCSPPKGPISWQTLLLILKIGSPWVTAPSGSQPNARLSFSVWMWFLLGTCWKSWLSGKAFHCLCSCSN